MTTSSAPATESDQELDQIVEEEQKVLARVQRTLLAREDGPRRSLSQADYDAELVALRDQIRDARLEDIPPLVEEMERLQQVALRRAQVSEGQIDKRSPYFGRLLLEEDEKKREVLIGRATFLDPKTGIRIVDWRDAPVSRIYYRYEEGDDYEETFGDRDVEGEVLLRRTLGISDGRLKRIGSPQGSFQLRADGSWRRLGQSAVALSGGQGAAMRPESHHKPGTLGVGDADAREDKSLSEITALIDPRQFELISRPTSGVVVIQGGAGSGKTTIGLHRLAYLAFQDKQRFTPENMLVVVFNDALVRYISRVLPSLGAEGVHVVTYERWAEKARRRHFPHVPISVADDTPAHVIRLKKHPRLKEVFDERIAQISADISARIVDIGKRHEGGGRALRAFEESAGQPIIARLHLLSAWLDNAENESRQVNAAGRHELQRTITQEVERSGDVVALWADLLTDAGLLRAAFQRDDAPGLSEAELEWCHAYCTRRCTDIVAYREERLDRERDEDAAPQEASDHDHGIDGASEKDTVSLDREDDALLLHAYQQLVGPLRAKKRQALTYEHAFVDEAQDLSPVEMSVVLDTVSGRGGDKSVTFAGDVAQRLHMDNGFTDWRTVLAQLGLSHVEIEPLKLSYRSTAPIIEFATDILGHLRNEVTGQATRGGAPVELFRFGSSGETVGFLSEALRNLVLAEPLASVAVITRYPEQADEYAEGLKRGEVPNLRRIADQDFPFRPGVDVTDVRQVKGLEFDYVVLVECNSTTYPQDDEARHLLHIAATRAAHQLWITASGTPSLLLPEALRAEAG
ncbi:MAG: ATP-binding domain-containing protein [Sandaracinaceae bacterium]|nr:ATP-binding domain-containing protein [Sandaracinaceae bacterium]